MFVDQLHLIKDPIIRDFCVEYQLYRNWFLNLGKDFVTDDTRDRMAWLRHQVDSWRAPRML